MTSCRTSIGRLLDSTGRPVSTGRPKEFFKFASYVFKLLNSSRNAIKNFTGRPLENSRGRPVEFTGRPVKSTGRPLEFSRGCPLEQKIWPVILA